MPGTEQFDQQAPTKSLPKEQIPAIDLSALLDGSLGAQNRVKEQIRQACVQTGFFYVHNSGVKKQTIEAARTTMEGFFASPDCSPLKQNVHNRNAGGMKGWGPLFGEPAYQKGTIAHVESFDIGQQLSDETCRDHGIEPNIWPELTGFRESILSYYDEVTQLGRVISGVLSEVLGEEESFINRRSGETAPRTMRLLHYPGGKSQLDSRHVGISAHSDFECFTILYQTAAGLELTNVNGEWCQAPAEHDRFTIILGDMLERLSNGFLKATGHRVAHTPWKRYSMVLFFALDGDYEVAPLPQFISEIIPQRYAAVTQARHIQNELARAAEHSQMSEIYRNQNKEAGQE